MSTLTLPKFSKQGCEGIQLIMTDFPDHLNTKYHCRSALLYKQRMYQSFKSLKGTIEPACKGTMEYYLLSCAYVFEKVPKSILKNDVDKVILLKVILSMKYNFVC